MSELIAKAKDHSLFVKLTADKQGVIMREPTIDEDLFTAITFRKLDEFESWAEFWRGGNHGI